IDATDYGRRQERDCRSCRVIYPAVHLALAAGGLLMAAHSSNLVLPKTHGSVKGFTLLELMLSMFMLLLVTAAVFEQISQMQKKSSSEAMKVDLSQQGREFVDQTVRDLHMAGYPSVSMYSNADTTSQIVAAGLVRVSSTEILFEGDVNNDGNVYSVDIL